MNPDDQNPEQPQANQQPTPPIPPIDQPFAPQAAQQPTQPIEPSAPAPSFEQQPSSPTPASQPMVTPQPTEPMSGYASNPFRSFMKGLSDVLRHNPISSLTLGFLAAAIIFVTVIVGAIVAAFLSGVSASMSFIITTLTIIVVYALLLRMIAASTVIHLTTKEVSARQAFGKMSGQHFFKFVGAVILSALATGIATIALIIPGIIVGARLSLVSFVVYSEGLGGITAMKRSWQLTKGHTWEMIGVNLASVVTLGNGGLLALVGTQSGIANRYRELKAAEDAGQSTGKTHWMNYLLSIAVILVVVAYVVGGSLITYSGLQQIENSQQQIKLQQDDFQSLQDQFPNSSQDPTGTGSGTSFFDQNGDADSRFRYN